MQKTHKVSADTLKKLRADLDKLLTKRKEFGIIFGQAVEAGDPRENDEYCMVIEAIVANESAISELTEYIKSTVVVEADDEPGISIGYTVVVDVGGNESTFEIVNEMDANPMEGKLSLSSPIGKALAGKHAGDTVNVDLPKGTVKYKIKQVK